MNSSKKFGEGVIHQKNGVKNAINDIKIKNDSQKMFMGNTLYT